MKQTKMDKELHQFHTKKTQESHTISAACNSRHLVEDKLHSSAETLDVKG